MEPMGTYWRPLVLRGFALEVCCACGFGLFLAAYVQLCQDPAYVELQLACTSGSDSLTAQ